MLHFNILKTPGLFIVGPVVYQPGSGVGGRAIMLATNGNGRDQNDEGETQDFHSVERDWGFLN